MLELQVCKVCKRELVSTAFSHNRGRPSREKTCRVCVGARQKASRKKTMKRLAPCWSRECRVCKVRKGLEAFATRRVMKCKFCTMVLIDRKSDKRVIEDTNHPLYWVQRLAESARALVQRQDQTPAILDLHDWVGKDGTQVSGSPR